MANLRKYQIEAIASEILKKLNDKENEIEKSPEYKKFVKNLTAEAKALYNKQKQIQEKLTQVQKDLKDLLDCKYTVYGRDIEPKVKALADRKFNNKKISLSEIEQAVIISDLNNADDIIEAVLERFGYE